jgi:class 3 adenylate cyclase
LYIALKPTYLETYRGLTLSIPDFYTCEITCSVETMKALLREYGKNVAQFNSIFEKYVSVNTDKIARILWQKQPLPLTVVDYYKALANNIEEQQGSFDPSKALVVAQSWLPAHDYFERQFEVMKSIESRKEDVDFLHILRFCYEVGFDRTPDLVASLQRGIFGTSLFAEPTRKLGTWVYLSGQNYAMHDSAKTAVTLTDYAKMKMASYLTDHFLEIIPKGEAQLHSLGLFLGKNIQFIPTGDKGAVVSEHIYTFMKKKAIFERAFGRGVGEEFEKLDDNLQESILDYVDTEIEFGVGLADSLGERFADLDDNNRKRVLEKIYQGMLFARYFGQSVGRLYGRLSSELQSLVMSHAEKNPQFADGLGMGVGYVFEALEPKLKQEILSQAQKSFEISRGLGFGFGLTFSLMQSDAAKKVVAIADSNSELDTGFGMGLGASYASLPDNLRKFVLGRAGKDCEFAFGAGIYAAFSNRESCPREVLELMNRHTEVANGLGLGFGTSFFYLPEQFQSELEFLVKTNNRLDDGIGTGLGIILKHLPAQVQEMFVGKAYNNNAFATGFGYGIGFTWDYIGDALRQKAIVLANTNNEFARGLGIGLGCHIDYLKSTSFEQIRALADTNSELDRGLGAGAAWAWPYFSDDAKNIVDERMKNSGEFAKGLGFGLARIARHFPADKKEQMAVWAAQDPSFAEGFGEGTGHFLWSVYDREEKEQFLKRAQEYPEIAKGLGRGLGFSYSFFKSELDDTCKPLFGNDPNFTRGVGIGIGKAYKYLPEDGRSEMFHIAEGDVAFSIGFGEGIGTVYGYLEGSQRKLVMTFADEGSGFSRGLGEGLGSVLSYLTDDLKNEVLGYAAGNRLLSLGLGVGIATRISFLSEAVAIRIFKVAESNRMFAVGLGEGCGIAFPRLTQVTRNWLSSHANIDGFAVGLGIGTGKTKRHVDGSSIAESAGLASTAEFTSGIALGLGSAAARMSKHELNESLFRTIENKDNKDYASNFAFSLGHAFSTLSDDKRDKILEMIKKDKELLSGFGEGIGHYMPSAGSRLVEEIIHATGSAELEKGVARGIAASFRYLNFAEAHGVLQYANSHPEYGNVLGQGLAERFASFDEDRQAIILEATRQKSEFTKAFARTITKSLMYVSPETREKLSDVADRFPALEPALAATEDEQRMENEIAYAEFPVTGVSMRVKTDWNIGREEISFSGKVQNYCVCFVDMMDSTKVSANLTPVQLSRYYEIFLNSIALIARNFGARIVKNAGDALIFYFDDTSDPTDVAKFRNVLDCGLTMGTASSALNAKMFNEKLPPVRYRISADYGEVSVARSLSSMNEDLFGSAMNTCSKINSKAKPNGLVIGESLFNVVKEIEGYAFALADSFVSAKGQYAVYHVEEKQKRSVINPFERRI